MKQVFVLGVLAGVVLLSQGAMLAQQSNGADAGQTVSDQDIQMLRSDLRSQKKQIIAQNMQLTDAQAVKFWPVYDAYTQETTRLGDTRSALIKEYAESYDTMTDMQADSLLNRYAALDESTAHLHQEWIDKFRKVLTGKQTALFFQLDRRIALAFDLQLASAIPMVKQ